MKAYIDIENAHTQKIVTIEVPIIEYIENKIIKFDISKLTSKQKNYETI